MSAENFFQTVRGARAERPIGLIGQWYKTHDYRSITGINKTPQAAQVDTVSIPASPDDSTEYSATVDGVAATFTTDASATQTELGEGLAAAINATAGIRGKLTASYSGGTLTLTGNWPGVSFTTVAAGGTGGGAIGAASTSTSADAADPVDFGLALCRTGQVAGEAVPTVAPATASLFTKQLTTLTFAGGSGAYYSGALLINGTRYLWQADWNSSLDQTCTDIASAINAAAPANVGAVAASVGSSSGEVTLTADVAGAEFDVEANASGAATAAASVAYTTGPSIATSLKRALIGVSVRRMDVENQTVDGDDPAYPGNGGVEVARRGRGVVQRDTSETWTWGDALWVSVASATKGRFYNAAAANRVWIGDDLAVVDRPEHSTTTDGIGVIRLDMGA